MTGVYSKYVDQSVDDSVKIFTKCSCGKEIEIDYYVEGENQFRDDPCAWCICTNCGMTFDWLDLTAQEFNSWFKNPINTLPNLRTFKL